MRSDVTFTVNGVPRRADATATVAAALIGLGVTAFRHAEHGAPRAPLCGMGTCFECRVTIDGVTDVRSCLVGVREGMHVDTT